MKKLFALLIATLMIPLMCLGETLLDYSKMTDMELKTAIREASIELRKRTEKYDGFDVLFNKDGLLLYLTKNVDEAPRSVYLECVVVNNTGKDIDLVGIDSMVVNEWRIPTLFYIMSQKLLNGEKIKAKIIIEKEDCQIASFSDVKQLKMDIYALSNNERTISINDVLLIP